MAKRSNKAERRSATSTRSGGKEADNSATSLPCNYEELETSIPFLRVLESLRDAHLYNIITYIFSYYLIYYSL